MQMHRIWTIALPFALLALLASCAEAPKARSVLDTEKVSADVLLEADRQFALEVAERGLEAWVDWFEEEGFQLAPGEVVRGKTAIRAYMKDAFGTEGFLLEWEPEHASISASGDLGYTFGRYTAHRTGEDGSDVIREGRYITIWHKQPDGTWKVALDTGVPDPPPSS
jgi:ketosteroid isomerase-like protein